MDIKLILTSYCGIVTHLAIKRYIRYMLLPSAVDMHSLNCINQPKGHIRVTTRTGVSTVIC